MITLVRRSMLLVIALILTAQVHITPSAPAMAQSTASDAPYIFYYSTLHNGFIVERADGSDTRIFGQGLSPTPYVAGPGWSPSNTYFAWTTLPFEGPGFPLERDGWLINLQTGERLTWLDDIENFDQIGWSPTEDVLLVIRALYPGHWAEEAERTLYLIDVANNELITLLDFTDERTATWSANGQHILLVGRNTSHVSIIGRDGTMDDRTQADPTFAAQSRFARWMEDGKLMWVDPIANELVLETLPLGDTTTFPLPETIITSMVVAPEDGLDLIVGSEDGNWHLNPATSEFEPISSREAVSWYRQLMGSPYIIFDQDDTSLPQMAIVGGEGLLTDEVIEYAIADSVEYLLYVEPNAATEDMATLAVYDVGSETSTLINGAWRPHRQTKDPKHEVSIVGRFPPAYERNATWSPETFDVYIADSDRGVRFNVTTGETQPLEQLYGAMNFSPDRQTLFYHGVCPPLRDIAPPYYSNYYPDETSGLSCFWNLETSETTPIPPHSHNVYNRTPTSIAYWHPSSEWVFIVSHVDVGGAGIPNYTLTKRDGTMIRDFTDSCRGHLCVQWLPDDVDVDLIAPTHLDTPAPSSISKFDGHDWLVSAVEWSPDGQLIASAEEWGGISVWNVETHALMLPEFATDRTVYGLSWSTDGTQLAAIASSPQEVDGGATPDIFPPTEIVIWDMTDTSAGPVLLSTLDESGFTMWDGNVLPFTPDIILQLNYTYGGEYYYPTRSYAVSTSSSEVVYIEGRVAISRNGEWLASVSDEAVLTITNLHSGQVVSEVDIEVDDPQYFSYAWNRLALSNDGRYLAMSEWSASTRLYNTTDGTATVLYPSARGLSFNNDGSSLALGASYAVLIYELPLN